MPQVTMPQLGEGVEEGTIGKWLKAVGDHVRVGDPLVEVVTDKVNAEVPSPFEGTLTNILVQEGETVGNDAPIADVDDSGAAATPEARQAKAAPAEPAPAAATSRARSSSPGPGPGSSGSRSTGQPRPRLQPRPRRRPRLRPPQQQPRRHLLSPRPPRRLLPHPWSYLRASA